MVVDVAHEVGSFLSENAQNKDDVIYMENVFIACIISGSGPTWNKVMWHTMCKLLGCAQ